MTYISCFSDFAFYFYYYFMENCHTWIIISMWQNDLHTNTSRSVWPILYGLMIKMLQYKMYPAGELAVLRQLLYYYDIISGSRWRLFGVHFWQGCLWIRFPRMQRVCWQTMLEVVQLWVEWSAQHRLRLLILREWVSICVCVKFVRLAWLIG